jgi:phosphoribosylanthranilate isomerase
VPDDRPPIRIKICGCTDPADFAEWKGSAVDAVGLNFFSGSKRYLAPERRRAVAEAIPVRLLRVGVFVNEMPEAIRQAAQECGLDYVQLHGDEPPEVEAALEGLPVIRAIRCVNSPQQAVEAYFRRNNAAGVPAAKTLLLDAYRPGAWGGTGATLPWDELESLSADWPDVRWLLAGGLTPENVAEAIEQAKPFGVDVAGGVEASPGHKEAAAVRRFSERADAALRKQSR